MGNLWICSAVEMLQPFEVDLSDGYNDRKYILCDYISMKSFDILRMSL